MKFKILVAVCTVINLTSLVVNIIVMTQPSQVRAFDGPTVGVPVYSVAAKQTEVAYIDMHPTAEQIALAVLSGRVNLETRHLYLKNYQTLGFDLTRFDVTGRLGVIEYPSADDVRKKAEKILLDKIGARAKD